MTIIPDLDLTGLDLTELDALLAPKTACKTPTDSLIPLAKNLYVEVDKMEAVAKPESILGTTQVTRCLLCHKTYKFITDYRLLKVIKKGKHQGTLTVELGAEGLKGYEGLPITFRGEADIQVHSCPNCEKIQ